MVYDYVIGMDVGKYFHHACVLDSHGAQVLSKRINQNEQSLRALFSNFCSGNNKVLVVVDQPNNIGRLTVAVAQDLGIDVRYLPGLAMRQLSRIHAGNAKTDIRDAYIIAHAERVKLFVCGVRFIGICRSGREGHGHLVDGLFPAGYSRSFHEPAGCS